MGFEGANQMPNMEIIRRCAVGAAAVGVAAGLGGCKSAGATAAGGAPQGSASVAVVTATGTAGSVTRASASSAAVSSATSTSAGAGAAAVSNSCAGGALSVQETSPDSSLGHRAYVFVFTNKGSKTCTVSGYPGAAVAGTSGKVVLNAQRSLVGYEGGVTKVTTVTLAPGASASAVIEWDVSGPAGSACPGAAGGHLLITPPNTTTTSKFALPNDLCGDFQTHPVVAGTGGRSAG